MQVSVVPGYLGVITEESEVVRIANEIGYPVMVKASGGGGGKGMRVAYSTFATRVVTMLCAVQGVCGHVGGPRALCHAVLRLVVFDTLIFQPMLALLSLTPACLFWVA